MVHIWINYHSISILISTIPYGVNLSKIDADFSTVLTSLSVSAGDDGRKWD